MTDRHPVARYLMVEMTLATRIRGGFYNTTGLPGERTLAVEFHVARITIRNALKRLEDQGLVVRSERRGTLPASTSRPPRKLLREHVDKFLDRSRRDNRKVLSFGRVAVGLDVAEALEMQPSRKVLRVVRLRSDSRGPSVYTVTYVAATIEHILSRAAVERRGLVQLLEDHGITIGTAQQSVTCEGAPHDVAQALVIPLGAPAMKLARLIRDETGAPLQYVFGWYRADRFQMRMDMLRSEDAVYVWMEQR